MRINPEQGSIEVGNIIYSKTLKKTRVATETQYLLAKYVFETLGYRRYEWKCDNLNAPSNMLRNDLDLHMKDYLDNLIFVKVVIVILLGSHCWIVSGQM